MNHEVALSLKLLDESAERLRFRLAFHNVSNAKLLFPYPEIRGLQFVNTTTVKESEWYTDSAVSSTWAGFTLEPGEVKEIDYSVHPCMVDSPHEDDGSDYYRWCVELPVGEYFVCYRFHVGEDYFCCDSHYRFQDLLREAESGDAVVWTGDIMSNRLHIARI